MQRKINNYMPKIPLYMTSIDISKTNGPGVNEREFIPYLLKLTNYKTHLILPQPKFSLPRDIPIEFCTFTQPIEKRNNILSWIRHQISIINCFRKVFAKKQFDYIIMRVGIFPVAYWYLTQFTNREIPYVLKHIGNGKFDVFKKKSIIFQIFSPLNRWLFASLLKKARMADVVSEAQRKSIIENYNNSNKVFFIDNGVNINKFFPKPKKGLKSKLNIENHFPIIGYAGNLAWERGGMQIILALPEIIRDYPNSRALILGDGDKMELLYNKARELEVLDYCIFTGQVDYDQVPDYVNCMDITVSIRYEDTQHASELKVRQYLACGKPVIISPGSNEFVASEGVGFIVDPHNTKEFLNACQKILNLSNQDYLLMSERARSLAINKLSYESKVIEKLNLWEKYTSVSN